jgi:Peptidase_C39 like family
MITTRKKSIKKIEDLSFDLEIMNPIESKALFGGGHYLWTDTAGWVWVEDGNSWTTNNVAYGPEITIGGNNNHFTNFGNYDSNNPTLNGGYLADWNNYGGNGNGGGGDPNHEHYDINIESPIEEILYNAPSHICQQAPQSKTCATMALSYVANYLQGGTGLTSSDFAEMSGLNYTSMLTGGTEGLTNFQVDTIMNTVFYSTMISGNTESLLSNLNLGNPILATVSLGGGIGHQVVIIGYNANSGTVQYMDSIEGRQVTSFVSELHFTADIYAVTGIRNTPYVDQYRNDTNDIHCLICGH